MGYKNTSGGWKLSTYIHWPKLVLEFFTLWLSLLLVKEIFPNHIQFELIFLPQLLPTSKMPCLYLYCGTYRNLIYIDYLYTYVSPIWCQFNSTEFTGQQPCTSHTAGRQDCELRKLTGFVLFICVSVIVLTIMRHPYMFVGFEIGAFIFKGRCWCPCFLIKCKCTKPSVKNQIDELMKREWTETQAPGIKQMEEPQNAAGGFSRKDTEWGK